MAKDTHKVIDIDVGAAQTSIKDLRKEMSGLRDALLNLKEGTEEYEKVQDKLVKDQKRIDSVMKATKKTVDALPGSYNAIAKELKQVKEAWKATNDEAERDELGKKAKELNDKLKELDSSVGNFQRNVGNYKSAFKDAFVGILNGSTSSTVAVRNLGTTIKSVLTANPVTLLASAFATLKNAIQGNERAMDGIHEGMKKLEPVLNVFRNVIGVIGEVLGKVIGALGNVLSPLIPVITRQFAPLINILKQVGAVFEFVGKVVGGIADIIMKTLMPVIETAEKAFDRVQKGFVKGLDYMAKPFKSFINMIISGVEGVVKLLSKLPFVGGKFDNAVDALERAKQSVKDFNFASTGFFRSTEDAVNDLTQTTEQRLAGTYRGLQRQLKELREEWEATNSEAERITIGKKIQDVEKQIEDMEKTLRTSVDEQVEKVRLLEGTYAALQEQLHELTKAWQNCNDEAKRLELASQIQDVNDKIAELEKELQVEKERLENSSNAVIHLKGSYAALSEELRALKKAWEESNDEAERKILGKKIEEVDLRMKTLENTTKGFDNVATRAIDNISKTIYGLANPVNVAKRATIQLGGAFKALIANPIGAAIAAIVVIAQRLKKGFEQSSDATNKLKVAFSAFEPITNAIRNSLTKVANVIGDILMVIPKLVESLQNAIIKAEELLNKLHLLSDEKLERAKARVEEQKRLVEVSVELAQREIDIEDRKRRFSVEEAKLEMEISELRAKAAETQKYTEKERIAFYEEAKNKEKALLDERLAIAKEELAIEQTRQAALTNTTDEEADRLAEKEANLYRVQKDYNDRVRALNTKLAKSSTETQKTIQKEEDKTLEHEKNTLKEKQSMYEQDSLVYLQYEEKLEEIDWKMQQERLKNEKYTDEQIQAFAEAHEKRLADIRKKVSNIYNQGDVEEEVIDEEPVLDYLKRINEKKIALAKEYSAEYYELLRQQAEYEYDQEKIKLDVKGATNEEFELLELEHQKRLSDIAKEEGEKRLEEQRALWDATVEGMSEMANESSSALSSIGDAWESVLEAQLKTGKISEKEYETRKKNLQKFQIAAIVAQTASSIFDVWAGYAKEVGVINAETAAATGPVAAATKAALDTKSLVSAIAKTTALSATSVSQIAAVKSGGSSSSSGSSMVSATAIPDTAGVYSGPTYTRNLQTDQEKAESRAPIYVRVTDINDVQNTVRVRESESTF